MKCIISLQRLRLHTNLFFSIVLAGIMMVSLPHLSGAEAVYIGNSKGPMMLRPPACDPKSIKSDMNAEAKKVERLTKGLGGQQDTIDRMQALLDTAQKGEKELYKKPRRKRWNDIIQRNSQRTQRRHLQIKQ